MKPVLTVMLLAGLVGLAACGTRENASNEQTATRAGGETKSKEPETIVKDNGLQIQIIQEGEGEGLAYGQIARMHYTGWLFDENAEENRGRQFDSSRDKGRTLDFQQGITGLIQGWTQGAEGMKVGERRILTIPPELGYGAGGMGPVIPPDATLIFDIELVEIVGN